MKLKKLLCANVVSSYGSIPWQLVALVILHPRQKSQKRRQPKKRQMLQVKQQIQRKKMDLQPH